MNGQEDRTAFRGGVPSGQDSPTAGLPAAGTDVPTIGQPPILTQQPAGYPSAPVGAPAFGATAQYPMGPGTGTPPPPGSSRSAKVAVALSALAALAVTAVALVLVIDKPSGPGESAAQATRSSVSTAEPPTASTPTNGGTGPVAPPPLGGSTVTAPVDTGAPLPTPTDPPDGATPTGSSTGTPAAPMKGSYVAMLWSDMATNVSPDTVNRMMADRSARYGVPTAVVDGNDYRSLRSGTVGVVYAGGFSSPTDAAQWCWNQGVRNVDDCFGVGLNDDWGPQDRNGTGRTYISELSH